MIFFIIWYPGDENLKKYNFPWTFLLGLFLGENQDLKTEFKQKIALLQNCSRLVIFLAVFRWINIPRSFYKIFGITV